LSETVDVSDSPRKTIRTALRRFNLVVQSEDRSPKR
jgi:hypothetical protein